MYYNTTNLYGEALKEAKLKAGSQNEEIYMYFLDSEIQLHTPSKIFYHCIGKHWPLTSIRRALHTLTEKGLLVKTEKQSLGLYGKPEHNWRLK